MLQSSGQGDGPSTSGSEQASSYVGQIVAPGDIVLDLTQAGKLVRIGGGLQQDGTSLVVTKAGRLRHTKPSKYWVEGSQRRYVPAVEDVVVGVVVERYAEHLVIDIGGPVTALLPALAFEGATRRNKPNLNIGDSVYARVTSTSRDTEPTLACHDASGRAAGFGPLAKGYLFQCSTGLARTLLSRPTCAVLEALGGGLSFELAVGMNGKVWVDAASAAITVLVANAIINSEFLSPTQAKIMVKSLLKQVQQP
ncbi:Exosomal 3'-5' exoribonuclease complex subunit Rrp40 [Klebsormidium nitens]|uniref:Ribosomal RNA-processing protein 40 n=1 Tax=Klebsormidium nitens TaxID=105231 RepID=A0A1Y1I0B7_KLENI|nr:Exosomal 3'-5' exoribonuclease complex subunit Rrp40 [Klebsormidium nitens]|eukprot:GAQ81548.1 Exosomal 3'-5' exoribonuclease complex subunit Rrp40 [Klebsormidium nitens]